MSQSWRATVNALQTQGKPHTAVYSPPLWPEALATFDGPVVVLVQAGRRANPQPAPTLSPTGFRWKNPVPEIRALLAAVRGGGGGS